MKFCFIKKKKSLEVYSNASACVYFQLDNANKDEPMGTAGVRVAKETSELDSVRNIDTSQLKSKYVLVAVFVLVIATLIAALFQHHSDCL